MQGSVVKNCNVRWHKCVAGGSRRSVEVENRVSPTSHPSPEETPNPVRNPVRRESLRERL